MRSSPKYRSPAIKETSLDELLAIRGVTSLSPQQQSFLAPEGSKDFRSHGIFYAGDLSILQKPAVSIVGTRKASPEGAARARRLARSLAAKGISVVSGLADGIDTYALNAAIDAGGKTTGVIGTPMDKATPIANARLQETIYRDHLLISQFKIGERVFPSNFPKRNRLMAAISDGTIVVEASDTSGTLHQSAECVRLGRWLFILKSVVDDKTLTWPRDFLGYEKCIVLESAEDVISRVLR